MVAPDASSKTPPVSTSADGDVAMEDGVHIAAPAAETRLTMAELLRRNENIRRDAVSGQAARRRVETPKPLAVDIEAIERQYAAGLDWSTIESSLVQARPYQLPKAKFDMVIDTGKALAKTSVHKILASLAGPDHGNSVLEELYKQFEIGQISKMPGGNLRVKVKTKDACVRLEHTKVNILGGVFSFKAFDILGDKYYLDIANIDCDMDTNMILHRLFLLGCKPVYDTFREVNLTTGVTSATWRVYFLARACPPALIVNNGVCDQLIFDNKLHPVHGKDAPFASERMPFGYRSLHALELGAPGDVYPPPASSPAASHHRQQNKTTSGQAVPATPAAPAVSYKSSLQTSINTVKKNAVKQPQNGAQHSHPPAATSLVTARSVSSALSLTTLDGSHGTLSPPSSPKSIARLLLTNGDDGFSTVTNKRKRGRNAIDFSNLMVKQQPQPLDGIATSNYFQELQSMEVKFLSKDVTVDKKYGARRQIIPVDVQRPDAVKTSTESAFFIEKHHTKIKTTSKASPIMEVTQSMMDDENTALLNTLPDRLMEADTKVEGICKLLEHATNVDHITKQAVECPLAFNSAMSLKMAGNGIEIAELAQLHVINRVLSASQPRADTTFSNKWRKLMKCAVPSKRRDIFTECAKWWTSSESIKELSRATKALGLFEFALLTTAPTIFKNDHWIQYLTGQPVEWIPVHNTRLLHPNTLLRLLRSELGEHLMKQWAEVQWQGPLLDDLEMLRQLDGYYPADESVLQLQVVNDSVVMVAGGLARRS